MEQPDLKANARIHYVQIINNGDQAFTDRYDGVPIRIEPGASENLPLDMAAHILGYGHGASEISMFNHICKRQGWNTPAHIKPGPDGKTTLAQELFGKLKIRAVIYKMVEEKPDVDAPIPADPVIPEVEDLPPLPKRRRDS